VAYIGNNIQNQGFSPAVDYFNGDGTTVTFTLSRPVASVAQLTAVIENVIQNPSTAFNVSGNEITFTSAPPAGSNNIWVEYTSLVTTYAAISQDPSVIGDITATGGYLAEGDFGNSFIDGTIVDYVSGNARITTGPSDAMTFYNGGTSSRTAMGTFDTSGNFTNNATGYTRISTGTTAQRPGTPTAGMHRMNTTTGFAEYWNGSQWASYGSISTTAIDYLVVAGGGGGGGSAGDGWNAGGGGAGGMVSGSGLTVLPGTSYTITVGAGGGSGTPTSSNNGAATTQGGDGGGSSIGSLVTTVGGGGGGAASGTGASGSKTSGRNGGSGGGAGINFGGSTPPGGSGTSGQGNSGGSGATGGSGWGGAGGGKNAAGTSNTSGGGGGAGAASSITGTSVTYATGGGTATSSSPSNAAANTGNGGDSAILPAGTSAPSGNGGSGIVVISYPLTFNAASASGSFSVSIVGSNRVYIFTGSGTITF
jgi:hypothetical protein